MYNAPPPNLMHGIQLVQAGRHAEALPYLRHAIRTEPITAEGWLWLAAATNDREEYRHCVNQALRLDASHPTAQRMRDDLYRTAPPIPQPAAWNQAAPGFAPPYIPSPDEFATLRDEGDTTHIQRPGRWRRVLRALVVLVIIGGGVAGITALVASGMIQDTVKVWLDVQDMHTLDFSVGETPTYRFRVEVPESWLPANTDNQSWRDKRDALIARYPASAGGDNIWEQIDESFSKAVRDPVYGDLLPPVSLVETDPAQLDSSDMIAALTLMAITPFPGGNTGAGATICDRMRGLESMYPSGELPLPPGGETLATTLAARNKRGDCVFSIERRYTIPASFTPPTLPGQMPQTVRLIWLAVPVGTERYAAWTITFAQSNYADYDYAVERILSTLAYQG